jgi:hexosaminidase
MISQGRCPVLTCEGGDEVQESKWSADPDITSFMKKNGLNGTTALYAFYENKIQAIVRAPPNSRTVVNWVEAFDGFGDQLDKSTVIHVWKSKSDLLTVLEAGFRAILSDASQWYLTGS